MTFEERHPGLKGKAVHICGYEWEAHKEDGTEPSGETCQTLYTRNDIDATQIDKEIVRRAIDDLLCLPEHPSKKELLMRLKKELGL